MKTRKIVCLAAAFACVLALAGCGGGDKDSTSAAGNASGLKAGTYEATAPGMYDADVKVKVTIDDSGVITAVEIDSSTQTAGRGITVMVGGMIFLKPLAVALGSTPTILPYTESYLKIILIGAPFMTSSLVLNNQLRFQGSAAYAMVGIVTGAVINIALDPLLIFVCGMFWDSNGKAGK